LHQIPHCSNQKSAATDGPHRLLGEQAYCVRVNSFELTAHDARSLLLDKHSSGQYLSKQPPQTSSLMLFCKIVAKTANEE
jgi:hypothetical protein